MQHSFARLDHEVWFPQFVPLMITRISNRPVRRHIRASVLRVPPRRCRYAKCLSLRKLAFAECLGISNADPKGLGKYHQAPENCNTELRESTGTKRQIDWIFRRILRERSAAFFRAIRSSFPTPHPRTRPQSAAARDDEPGGFAKRDLGDWVTWRLR